MFDDPLQSLDELLLIIKIGRSVYNLIKKHNAIIKSDGSKNFGGRMFSNQLHKHQKAKQEAYGVISKLCAQLNTTQNIPKEVKTVHFNPKGNCAGLVFELMNTFIHKKNDNDAIDLFNKNLNALPIDFSKRVVNFQCNNLNLDLLAKNKLVATEWKSYYTDNFKINMSDFANDEFLNIFIHVGDFNHALCAGHCKLIKNYKKPQSFFFYDPNLPDIITFENKKDCENFMEDYFILLKKRHGAFDKKRLLSSFLRLLDDVFLPCKHNACICVTSITSFNQLAELRKLIQSISARISDKANNKSIISICDDILKSEFNLKSVETIEYNSIIFPKYYRSLSKSIASLLIKINNCKEFSNPIKKEYISNIYHCYIKHRPLFLKKYHKIIPILKTLEYNRKTGNHLS